LISFIWIFHFFHLDKQIVTTKEDNNKPSISANSGFSFTNIGNTTTAATDFQFSPKTPDTSSKLIFGNLPKLTFSDLAKQSAPTIDDTEKRGRYLNFFNFLIY